MRKKILLIPLVLLLAISLVAIGCPAPPPPPPPAEEEEAPSAWEWPSTLSITTSDVGTSDYVNCAAWTPLLEHMTGMKVRLIPEGNSAVQARLFKQRASDLLAMSSTELAKFVTPALGDQATRTGGPMQLRVVWMCNVRWMGFVVRADSYIKTIDDIKPGSKIGVVMEKPAFVAVKDGLIAWADVPKEEIVIVPIASYSDSMDILLDGRADVVWASCTSPVAVQGEASRHGIRWLDLDPKKDPEGAKRFHEYAAYPLTPGKQGVESSIGVHHCAAPGFVECYLDMDPELVYNLAKWFDENFDTYKDRHQSCATMDIKTFKEAMEVVPLPFHEGTIRYLKEKGMWTADDEAWQQANVTVLTRWVEAYDAAIAEADKRGIKVDPKNEEWVEFWASYSKDIPPLM